MIGIYPLVPLRKLKVDTFFINSTDGCLYRRISGRHHGDLLVLKICDDYGDWFSPNKKVRPVMEVGR